VNPLLNHINFAELINDDLERLSRFVAIDSKNFSTFSNENARLLLSSCAEIESMFKQIIEGKTPQASAKNIRDYFAFINTQNPGFCEESISSPRLQLTLQPFFGWSRDCSPPWWTAHNRVKHNRNLNFEYASIENMVNAVAALEITLKYYFLEMRLMHKTEVPFKFHNQRLFSA
jgi:hypothetical protein